MTTVHLTHILVQLHFLEGTYYQTTQQGEVKFEFIMRKNRRHDVIHQSHQERMESSTPEIMVHFNVGGKHFEILHATLDQIPNTKLSTLKESNNSYDRKRKQYYFDRNPYLFPFILDAYRAGRIHFPHSTCWKHIEEELAYWGLGEEYIAECCWRHFKCMEQTSTTLGQIEKNLVVSRKCVHHAFICMLLYVCEEVKSSRLLVVLISSSNVC